MALPRLFLDPFRRLPPNWRARYAAWLAGPSGRRVLAAEQAVLDEVLPCIFGYHAAQLCSVPTPDLLRESRILNRVSAGTTEDTRPGVALVCAPQQLPFATDSMDLLLLHHSLDLEDDPHQVLREAARAVIPGGALVVVGYNPWSLFGLLRWLRAGSAAAPWFARCIGPDRVGDWLRVLGLRVDGLESGYHLPPLEGERAVERLSLLRYLGERWLPQRGMFYVLVARKAVAPMTPVLLRPGRQARPVSIGVAAATRVTRNDP